MSSSKLRVCAVVQARNEERSIQNVLHQLLRSKVKYCVVVANGCTDNTVEIARSNFRHMDLLGEIVAISEALGPDVAKSLGTYAALRKDWVIDVFTYIDGDWLGGFGPSLEELLASSEVVEADMVFPARNTSITNRQAQRPDLDIWNAALKTMRPYIQDAAVAQSPSTVKSSVFRLVSPYWLYHPGLWLAKCLTAHESLRIRTTYGSMVMGIGNPTRSAVHQRMMLDTLIGDAVEGCCLVFGLQPHRQWQGKHRDGYHSSRRTDLLSHYMSSIANQAFV